MKKICPLLFVAANAAFGQAVTITPRTGIGNTTTIIKTPANSYGMEHTDGTVRINTYVHSINDQLKGGWLQTASDHPLIFATYDGDAQLYLNNNGNIVLNPSDGKTGNVGIGLPRTTTPAEKLTVGGNISSSALAGTGSRPVYSDLNGTLTNTAPVQTYSVIVSPQVFQKDLSNSAGTLVTASTYYDAGVSGSGVSDVLTAPVSLPVGATITQVQAYFIDSFTPGNLRFILYRSAVDDITGTAVATLFQDTVTPVSPATISSITSAVLSESVTDKKYFYIQVTPVNTTNTALGTWATVNRMSIKGIKITYTL